ncbi:MAG: enoyl-CoA hydratase/isomerase family protein [Chloroflexi bacterium]|nr:enoyl-CoA hydratase/isomerase family protein [Chloroflexota bacterium]
MQGFKTLLYNKRNAIAHIVLNRPEVLNAYNIQMRDDLWEALLAVRDDPEVGALVLSGAGERAFCAGADLTEFGTAPSRVIAREVRWQRDVWGLFLSIGKPLIAALHGYVLGSGLEMALCCDIRIASEDAQFGLPETSLGMIPAAGGTQTLPRVIKQGKALEMLLTSARIDAGEAYRIGLVNRVVPKAGLMEEAAKTAKRIFSHHPGLVGLAKGALYQGLDVSLDEGLAMERRYAAFAISLGLFREARM